MLPKIHLNNDSEDLGPVISAARQCTPSWKSKGSCNKKGILSITSARKKESKWTETALGVKCIGQVIDIFILARVLTDDIEV